MDPESKDQWSKSDLLLLGAGFLVVPVAGFGLYLASPQQAAKKLCDEAIMATLRAPATYKRVEFEGSGSSYRISYDAANAFGTPIRGYGYCSVEGSPPRASWLELDRPISEYPPNNDLSGPSSSATDVAAEAEKAAEAYNAALNAAASEAAKAASEAAVPLDTTEAEAE